MLIRSQRSSSAAAWELLSCGKAAGARDQFAPLTRASAASTPAIAMFLIALTSLLAAGRTLAIHPLTAILLTLGAMALLLQSAEEICRGPRSSNSSC